MATVLRPNTAKVLWMSLLKVMAGVVVAVIILVVLQMTAGLEVFAEIFVPFGITLDPTNLLQWAIIAVVIIAVGVVFYSYFSIISVSYEFFDMKMTITTPSMLILKNTKDISYHNISNVTFEDKEFFAGLFNTGTIILDLSSMGEKEMKLNYIDDPQNVANTISNILRAFRLKEQAEYTEQHKINSILDRGNGTI